MIKDTDLVMLICEYCNDTKTIQTKCSPAYHLEGLDICARAEACADLMNDLAKEAKVWSCRDYYSDPAANMRLAVLHFITSFGTVENPSHLLSCGEQQANGRDLFVMSPTAITRKRIQQGGGDSIMKQIIISSYYDKETSIVTISCQGADDVQKTKKEVKELLRVIARITHKSNTFFRDDYLTDPHDVTCECFGEFLQMIRHLLPSDIANVICVSRVRYIMRVGSHDININDLFKT